MDEIVLILKGDPKPQGRPRAYFNPKAKRASVYNKKCLEHDHYLLQVGVQYKQAPLEGPLDVIITFYLNRPKSKSVKKYPYPACKPDIDNLAKAVLDIMNGLVFKDDGQIVSLLLDKKYCTVGMPRTVVIINGSIIDGQ